MKTKGRKQSKNVEDLTKVKFKLAKGEIMGLLNSGLGKDLVTPLSKMKPAAMFLKGMDKLGAKSKARQDLIVKAAKANAETQKKIEEAAKKKAAMKKKPKTYSEMQKSKKF